MHASELILGLLVLSFPTYAFAQIEGDGSASAGGEPSSTPDASGASSGRSSMVGALLESLVEPPSRPRYQGLVRSTPPDAVETPPSEPVLQLGGALRFNLFFKTWDQPETIISGGDDVAFDTFRLNVDSYYAGFHLSAEYRFYAGYNMLHHGYLAYIQPDFTDVAVGVMRAPFGITPYASHNWFFGLTYYLGFEDDHDLGIRNDYELGPIGIQLAYFRNDEGSYSGNSVDSARYSYDVVRASPDELGTTNGPRRNEEKNQGNLRITYTAEHEIGFTEIGASGQIGGIENGDTDDNGLLGAIAGHIRGRYGPVDIHLQGIHYDYELANPPGQNEQAVVLGAYDSPFLVAAEGQVFTANVAYKLKVDWHPIESFTFYNNYSLLIKSNDAFPASHQNTVGTLLHAGPVYAYFDTVIGKHHPWIGASYTNALAGGNANDAWEARFNVNIGYYF